MSGGASFIPNPPVARHGVIGDRRTAALVAADGTIPCLCLPCYDGVPIFGALLNVERGGFWRMGAEQPALDGQQYVDATSVLITRWETDTGILTLTDLMAWPWDGRRAEQGGWMGALYSVARAASGVRCGRSSISSRGTISRKRLASSPDPRGR
jgi:hypothetical protein